MPCRWRWPIICRYGWVQTPLLRKDIVRRTWGCFFPDCLYAGYFSSRRTLGAPYGVAGCCQVGCRHSSGALIKRGNNQTADKGLGAGQARLSEAPPDGNGAGHCFCWHKRSGWMQQPWKRREKRLLGCQQSWMPARPCLVWPASRNTGHNFCFWQPTMDVAKPRYSRASAFSAWMTAERAPVVTIERDHQPLRTLGAAGFFGDAMYWRWPRR